MVSRVHRVLVERFEYDYIWLSELASDLASKAGYTVEWNVPDYAVGVRFSVGTVAGILTELAFYANAKIVFDHSHNVIRFNKRD